MIGRKTPPYRKNLETIIEPFVTYENLSYELRKRAYISIQNLVEANPTLDIHTYFTDTRLLTGKKLIQKQDEITIILKNFVRYLENRKCSSNTIKNYLSSIKQLHDYHHMNIPTSEWKQIRKTNKQNGKIFHTTAPTKEQLRQILSNANALDKAYFLTLICTGKRPEEILRVNYKKDLFLDEKPPRIVIRMPNTETKRRTPYAFLTEECKQAIQDYMKQRHLFLNRIINSHLPIENKEKFEESSRLFEVSIITIRERWNKLLKKAELDETSSNGNGTERHKFNHYSLRYFFRSYLGNKDLAEHLMGHTDIANLYNNKQEHEIAKDYLNFSKNLYIFGSKDLDETIKQELKEKDEQIQRLITNDEINKRQLEEMKEQLNRINEIMNMTEQKAQNFIKINDTLYEYDEDLEVYFLRAWKNGTNPPDYLNKNKKPLKNKNGRIYKPL